MKAKRCPFCRTKNPICGVASDGDQYWSGVTCRNRKCLAHGPGVVSKRSAEHARRKAIKKWNERAKK